MIKYRMYGETEFISISFYVNEKYITCFEFDINSNKITYYGGVFTSKKIGKKRKNIGIGNKYLYFGDDF